MMVGNPSVQLITFGANLPSVAGEPEATFAAALAALEAEGARVVGRSRLWSTPAWPPGSGPAFVNAAAALGTTLSPAELLQKLHEIEAELGRRRTVRWGPRVCDLDLIASGATILPDRRTVADWMERQGDDRLALPAELLLPHPRMHERGFVLAPLADIAPDWRHPINRRTVAEMLATLPEEALEDIVPLD